MLEQNYKMYVNAFKICLSWLSAMFFDVNFKQVLTWFLLQFGVESTCKFFQIIQITLAQLAHAILLPLKNLFMLINTKLHLKSCYYLY